MSVPKDVAKVLARAEAFRVEIGYEGTVAEMLTDSMVLFASRYLVEKVERAEKAAGRQLASRPA